MSNLTAQSIESNRILFSVPECAFKLNVSKAQVRQWISAGMLRTVKLPHSSGIGFINRTLIHINDLEAFANRFRTEVTK